MRTVFRVVTAHHVAIVGILLLLALVMLGAANCDDDAAGYQLTISSTAGGTVTSPGEGTFNYIAGTVVELVATPDDGYEFRGWTGDIGQIADRNSPSTTIAVEGNHSINAGFDDEAPTLVPTLPPSP